MTLPMARRDFLRMTGYGFAAVPLARGNTEPARWRFANMLRGDVEEWCDLASVPAAVTMLLRDGDVKTLAVGTAHAGATEPVTVDTVFEAGSLGKPVFAFGVLRLAEAGKLDLDKPLAQYLELPDTAGDPRVAKITARHVLSHTTGLPNWRDTHDEPLKTMFEPGERFSYSGEGYFLLQRVVERISGQSIEHFAQEWILRPLEMKSSSYLWHPAVVPHLAGGHGGKGKEQETWNRRVGRELFEAAQKAGVDVDGQTTAEFVESFKKVEPKEEPVPNSTLPNVAGSLFTTPADYARFIRHLAAAPPKEMLKPHVTVKRDLSWALGWGLEKHAGRTFAWHWGDNYYFQNFVIWLPGSADALLVFTNGASGKKVYSRVVPAVTGTDWESLVWI
ncbi:MAG TPA: serine hydrolase domain-containing protein [Vicinamibacterales bacterium]